MEQCKAAIYGTYAARLRDPFLKDDSIETINHNSDTYLLCRPIVRPSQAAQRSNPEELNVSKSSPLVPSKLTSMKDAANSLTG
jgi:hypothetical protein